MSSTLLRLRDEFRTELESCDPDLYLADDAARMTEALAEIVRLANAAKIRFARRAAKGKVHEKTGHRNAGEWLAEVTGDPVGQSNAELETGRLVEEHPAIEQAFNSGAISPSRAKEAARAAEVAPEKAAEIARAAKKLDSHEFRKFITKTRSEGSSAEEEKARYERIRKSRYLRIWPDSDGSCRIDGRLCPDDGALLKAALEPFRKAAFEEARKSGKYEPQGAYLADALVEMARSSGGSGSDSGGVVRHLRIRADLGAVIRGHAEPGETVELPGVDLPLPVQKVREVLGDAITDLVITDGQDVRAVVTNSRRVTKALLIAIEERDQTCAVMGCHIKEPLERHHWIEDFSKNQTTSLNGIVRLCPAHHDDVTYRGCKLQGGHGNWRIKRPDQEPEDPDPPPRPAPEQTRLL